MKHPIIIQKHNRNSLVLVSYKEFDILEKIKEQYNANQKLNLAANKLNATANLPKICQYVISPHNNAIFWLHNIHLYPQFLMLLLL